MFELDRAEPVSMKFIEENKDNTPAARKSRFIAQQRAAFGLREDDSGDPELLT